MKIPLRYILLVLFILLALSFFSSMRQTSRQNAASQELLAQVTAEHERLTLQEAQLQHQLQLAEQPFVRERGYREAYLVKREGEQVLDLTNFDYQPRETPAVITHEPTPLEQWHDLLWSL